MKALVIGGSGFLGSHVADTLSLAGHEVTIFDIRKSPYLREDQKMIVGDLVDEKAVEEAVKDSDIVYNFAGIADMQEANARPIDTVRYNVLGNAIVLEAARKAKVKRFIFASSVYVYSDAGAFYRSSKLASELFIEDYHKVYGLPYTILRYGSLYGRRADEGNSIYKYLRQALEKGEITYYGTGDETREYIHVEDAARLSVEILDPAYENERIILTGPQKMKYRELLEMVKEMLGGKVNIVYKESKLDIHYRMTPYSFSPKIGKKLICNPSVDIGQGLLDCMAEIYDKIIQKEKHGEG